MNKPKELPIAEAVRLIVVGAEKGGTGKTTIAVNLAAMLALAGKSVMLVDTDRQKSASLWASARMQEEVHPTVPCCILDGTVGFSLISLKEKYDIVVVDAGGRDSVELRQAMAIADLQIIPVRPSQFDTWTLDSMAALRREIERKTGSVCPAKLVLNAISPNPASRESEEARAALKEFEDAFATTNTALVDRASFRRAARDGKSAIELTGSLADAKAAAELRRLYLEIMGEAYEQAAADEVAPVAVRA